MSNAADASAPRYDDHTARLFLIATVFWGIVGMLVGVIIALQLAWWPANADLPWMTFGRLRPVHTNGVIFAFAANGIFAGVYHSTQRLCRVRMWSDKLSAFHFWGWQALIIAAIVTFMLGHTQSKEYAEMIWPLDIAMLLIWGAFSVNFFATLATRKTHHIYVALWFYMGSIVTIAIMHVINNLAIPAGWTTSYPIYSGMTDALVQWWYGHNAVAFVLTTPFLGLMYYYLPKAANRPVYSYRLSIIHFWSLIFLYIWAGPHHLLYSALPDWAQTVGVAFSLMLLGPSWGGMLNGLLTLRGAWDRVLHEPILKFFAVGITFYGMATFEGPMLSIRWFNALSHFTDWTIAHVHVGALGWVGFITFAMAYYLVPILWGRELYSKKWAETHFWLGTIGILLYIISMWVAGVTEGLMWRALDEDGTRLLYPNFTDTLTRLIPLFWVRFAGGLMYLSGVCLMAFNFWKTVRSPAPVAAE